MNREERRQKAKNGAKVQKEPVINIKVSDIEKIKAEVYKKAIGDVFTMMLGLPVMVLHDKFGFGKVRCERFTDHVIDLYDSFEKDYIALDEVHEVLKREAGITISPEGKATNENDQS